MIDKRLGGDQGVERASGIDRTALEPLKPDLEAPPTTMGSRVVAFPGVPRRRGKPMDMRDLNRTLAWRKELIRDYGTLSSRLRRTALSELLACPICTSNDLRPFVEVHGFPYAECGACGHLFCRNPPASDRVRRMYEELGEIRSAQATLYADETLFARRVARIARPKVEHVSQLVPPRGTWLDVGCATGEILAAAREAGWTVRGVEADPGAAAIARSKGFDVVEDFVEAHNAGRHVADSAVISVLNIVEHLLRPVEVVHAIAGSMRSGAHLVIEVPRHPSLSSFAALAFPAQACRHLYAPEHLHVFTERALAVLLERSGLQPVSIWTFGQDYQELIATAALSGGVDEAGFYEHVYDLAPQMQRAIDDADFSDVILLVARK